MTSRYNQTTATTASATADGADASRAPAAATAASRYASKVTLVTQWSDLDLPVHTKGEKIKE